MPALSSLSAAEVSGAASDNKVGTMVTRFSVSMMSYHQIGYRRIYEGRRKQYLPKINQYDLHHID